jgi:hypothetical protein
MRRCLAMLQSCPSWRFVDADYPLDFSNWPSAPDYATANLTAGSQLDVDFIAIKMGDVNCSWAPFLLSAKANSGDGELVIGEAAGNSGDIVSVPIFASSGLEIAGVELHLNFGQDHLVFQGLRSNLPGDLTQNVDNGEIHLVWEDINNAYVSHDSEPLFVIDFGIQGSPREDAEVAFTSGEVVDVTGEPYGLDYSNGSVAFSGDNPALPDDYALYQNHPNPFNPSTEIGFSLPLPCHVELAIFDITGRQVAVVAEGHYGKGQHSVTWNASGFPSGIYLYRLVAGDFVEAKKMMLLK